MVREPCPDGIRIEVAAEVDQLALPGVRRYEGGLRDERDVRRSVLLDLLLEGDLEVGRSCHLDRDTGALRERLELQTQATSGFAAEGRHQRDPGAGQRPLHRGIGQFQPRHRWQHLRQHRARRRLEEVLALPRRQVAPHVRAGKGDEFVDGQTEEALGAFGAGDDGRVGITRELHPARLQRPVQRLVDLVGDREIGLARDVGPVQREQQAQLRVDPSGGDGGVRQALCAHEFGRGTGVLGLSLGSTALDRGDDPERACDQRREGEDRDELAEPARRATLESQLALTAGLRYL